MVYTYRCIIKREWPKYFVGEDYSGKKYKIQKNKNLRCKVGSDIYFYAMKKTRLFSTILIPVSDEEAGVKECAPRKTKNRKKKGRRYKK